MFFPPLCAWSGFLLQGCCWQEVMVVPWLVETVPGSSWSVELVWVEDLCSCTCSGACKGTKPEGFFLPSVHPVGCYGRVADGRR